MNTMWIFDSLNVMQADKYPLVTEHIPDIINFIGILLKKGYAYIHLTEFTSMSHLLTITGNYQKRQSKN